VPKKIKKKRAGSCLNIGVGGHVGFGSVSVISNGKENKADMKKANPKNTIKIYQTTRALQPRKPLKSIKSLNKLIF
jgi:hypothetical protein